MNKTLIVFSLSFLLLLIGCSKNNTVTNPISKTTGGMTLKFNPQSIPAAVSLITAELTRTGYTTITKNLNLLTDSTAEISIPAVQTGTWHLKVDAKDISGKILYTGQSDVTVQENVVVQISLTLQPVSSGTGTIYIFVTWGTGNSGHWTDFAGNPVLARNNNPSLPGGVAAAKVIFDNGIYKMWYEAQYAGAFSNIWYAESQDGISWNTIGSGPALTTGGSGSWDNKGIVPSAILKVNNQYSMYYIGANYSNSVLQMGLATSTDGIHWIKYNGNPLMSGIFATDIIMKDSTYIAYLNNGTDIRIATSLNGINWNMYAGNPVLVSTFSWETGRIGWPTVSYENNQFTMVYATGAPEQVFGMATSGDGFNFTKQSTPFFQNTNTINNYYQIAYPYFKKLNNEYRIYYTGNSTENSINIIRKLQ